MRDAVTAGEKLVSLSNEKKKLLELLLEKESRQPQAIKRRARNDMDERKTLPASLAQQRLWFIDQLDGCGAAYNITSAVRLRGLLDSPALQAAFDAVFQRHDSLRSVFDNVDGEPVQRIATDQHLGLTEIDLSGFERIEREARVEECKRSETQLVFDLARGPLIRVKLILLSADEHMLLTTMHHIVSDGWSMSVFFAELAEFYNAFVAKRAPQLSPLPIQYSDYAEWQRDWLKGATLDSLVGYWREKLSGAPPELELPGDRPRPLVRSFRGANVSVILDARITASLRGLAKRHSMTLFMILYAAWVILLSRLSGQSDVVIGTPVGNRQRPELSGLIGFFVNTLALRIQAMRDIRLLQFLENVKEASLDAFEHQHMPFEILVEMVRPERSASINPIFQVMFALQNTAKSELRLAELTASFEDASNRNAKFDLLLLLEERGDEVVGYVNYSLDLFDQSTVTRWVACLNVLLQAMPGAEQVALGELPILPEAERRLVVESFNATTSPYPCQKMIHEIVEEQVQRDPRAIAVTCGTRQLTYAELNRKANKLAHFLLECGVAPDDRVGLYHNRDLEIVVGLLGILKAGCAYVPFDTSYPIERVEYMLRDSAPVALVTQECFIDALSAAGIRMIALDSAAELIDQRPDKNPDLVSSGLSPSNLAYVIYTSGSTGAPKGVAIEHHSVVNLMFWHCAAFMLRQGDRCSCVAAVGFDAASWEIWPPLAAGATLVLASSATVRDAEAFLRWWAAQPLDVSFLPTPMAELLFSREIRNPQLRTLLVGGDRLSIRPKEESFELINNYGPTESTVVATSGRIRQQDATLHIGRPISNTTIYILDAALEPVPIGVPGELYIGGSGLARGYLNRPQLTIDRFVPDPFSLFPKARMYRTGDLARWRADGTIEFMGRNDEQVKIRGYRIELGEIEAQLARHDMVREVAVMARQDGVGEKRLVAYFTTMDCKDPPVEELRAHLKGVLPEYMIPSAFVGVASLPLTPNGKVDRQALPAPQVEAYANQRFEPPQGRVEKVLAEVWQESLQVRQIGRHDNFFELGGHSMLAVKALFKVNRLLGCTIGVTDAYTHPTVATLARRISGMSVADELIDLHREAVLDDAIVAMEGALHVPAQAILLTGSTGFVGRFLLAQLLHDTKATVFCLVRAQSKQQAFDRLRVVLATWDLWQDEFESRIKVIPGDLRLPRLGIELQVWHELAASIDSIYHCATSMNHLETYAMSKAANVDSAVELLRLATSGRPKLVNYISTLGVFRPAPADPTRLVNEWTAIDNEQHRASQGYVSSKWVAEKIFLIAAERGIPCNIFRIGLVWGDSVEGRFDELQHVYRVIKSCLLSGYGISNHKYAMPPTPVDYVARAVVFLAGLHTEGGIFHISSSRQMAYGVFERCNELALSSLELLPYYDWIQEIKRLHNEGQSLPAVPLVEFAFSMDEEAFSVRQLAAHTAQVRFDCTQTHRELESAGVVAPTLDDDLLRVCIESMLTRDPDLRERAVAALDLTNPGGAVDPGERDLSAWQRRI